MVWGTGSIGYLGPKGETGRNHIRAGSLVVGSFHTAPIKAPLSPLGLMRVVWEPYGRLPTWVASILLP